MTNHPSLPRGRITRLVHTFLFLCCCTLGLFAADPKHKFDLPASDAETSLKSFAAQSGREVIFVTESTKGIRTPAVQGEFTVQEALDQLLTGTPLVASQNSATGAVKIRREASIPQAEKNAQRAIASGDRPESGSTRYETDEQGNKVLKLDTFEVFGRKTLNMDIRRTRDDAQPYVVFERGQIERSGATSLEDFLSQRLTMNTLGTPNNQQNFGLGNSSSVNLRGLGTNQTLILIDGHRVASPIFIGLPQQPDINGIPLGAIERIEVLPATASGIYGGGATGGVVNIILRRDYAGAELTLTYENTFESDTALRRIQFNAGFNLEGGKTNVLLSATWSEQAELHAGDRGYLAEGRARIFANNPGFYTAGAPPLGTTANIRSTNGALLTLRGSGTALGSAFTSVPAGYAGPASDAGAGLAGQAGRYNFSTANSAQTGGRRAALRNGPAVSSVLATVRRRFGPSVEAFVDFSEFRNHGSFSRNGVAGTFNLTATAAGNPFNQPVQVTVPVAGSDTIYDTESNTRRFVAGAVAKLGPWHFETDYTWDRSGFKDTTRSGVGGAAIAAAVNNGTLNPFRDPGMFPVDVSGLATVVARPLRPQTSTFQNASVRAAGPLASLPGGTVNVSMLAEFRRDDFSDALLVAPSGVQTYHPSMSQEVRSLYMETTVPVVAAAQGVRAMRSLDMQLAGRWDEYRIGAASPGGVVGTTILREASTLHSLNPTIGLRLEPFPGLTLRASYGTGFLPPTVAQLVPRPQNVVQTVIDPQRGNAAAPVLLTRTGGNPGLDPESSESMAAGLIFSLPAAANLRLSVDYSLIDKTENITDLSLQAFVDNEGLFPSRITREPLAPGDPFTVGPLSTLDATSVNLARAKVESFDVALDLSREVAGFGKVAFHLLATRLTRFETRFTPAAPLVENVGIRTFSASLPIKLRGTAGVVWEGKSWSAGWTMRYFDSYQVATSAVAVLNQGSGGRVSSQTYHDVFVGWKRQTGAGEQLPWDGRGAGRLLRGVELQVGVRNVFNTEAHFDAGSSTSQLYAAFADPRDAVYYITAKKAL